MKKVIPLLLCMLPFLAHAEPLDEALFAFVETKGAFDPELQDPEKYINLCFANEAVAAALETALIEAAPEEIEPEAWLETITSGIAGITGLTDYQELILKKLNQFIEEKTNKEEPPYTERQLEKLKRYVRRKKPGVERAVQRAVPNEVKRFFRKRW